MIKMQKVKDVFCGIKVVSIAVVFAMVFGVLMVTTVPKNVAAWSTEIVDSAGDVGYYATSIAVDAEKGIHISYFDNSIKNLKYAYKAMNGSWSIEMVDSSWYDVDRYCSIAVDGANGVHISYYDEYHRDLKYAYKPSGGSWSTHTLDSLNEVGLHNSIAVDSGYGIHISYLDFSNKDIKYAYKSSGGSWSISSAVIDAGTACYDTSIAVDNESLILRKSFGEVQILSTRTSLSMEHGQWKQWIIGVKLAICFQLH
jgi:hypothetical protein